MRDQVLDRGRVEKGEVVLDIGVGDGLIAFGAWQPSRQLPQRSSNVPTSTTFTQRPSRFS